MKHLLLTMTLTLLTLSLAAQVSVEGISLGIPFSSFKKQLETRGFDFLDAPNSTSHKCISILEYPVAMYSVCVDKENSNVWSVSRLYTPYAWTGQHGGVNVTDEMGLQLSNEKHNQLKEEFMKKYGQPELEENENGQVSFAWTVANGMILLSHIYEGFFSVTYYCGSAGYIATQRALWNEELKKAEKNLNDKLARLQKQHIKFMDIELGQSYTDFSKQLLNKGFTYFEKSEYGYVYKGRFAGRNVELTVFVTDKDRKVWRVAVYFSDCSYSSNSYSPYAKTYLSSLKDYFKKLETQLSSKYGSSFHRTNGGAEVDGYEWNVDGGYIILYIAELSQRSYESTQLINLLYTDSNTADQKDADIIDDL